MTAPRDDVAPATWIVFKDGKPTWVTTALTSEEAIDQVRATGKPTTEWTAVCVFRENPRAPNEESS